MSFIPKKILAQKKLLFAIGLLSFIYFSLPLLLVFENYISIEDGFLVIPDFFILMINFMGYTLIGSIIIQAIYFLIGYCVFMLLAKKIPGIVLCFLLFSNLGISIELAQRLTRLASIDMQCQCTVNGRSLTPVEATAKFIQLYHESDALYILAGLNGLCLLIYLFVILKTQIKARSCSKINP